MKPVSVAAILLVILAGCGNSTSSSSFSSNPPTCPTDAQASEFVRQYAARQQIALPPQTMTMDGALCRRDKVTRGLAESYGRVVGYKAGLTNAALQKRFNHPEPLRGASSRE